MSFDRCWVVPLNNDENNPEIGPAYDYDRYPDEDCLFVRASAIEKIIREQGKNPSYTIIKIKKLLVGQ